MESRKFYSPNYSDDDDGEENDHYHDDDDEEILIGEGTGNVSRSSILWNATQTTNRKPPIYRRTSQPRQALPNRM